MPISKPYLCTLRKKSTLNKLLLQHTIEQEIRHSICVTLLRRLILPKKEDRSDSMETIN
jgi:hypothetical protein